MSVINVSLIIDQQDWRTCKNTVVGCIRNCQSLADCGRGVKVTCTFALSEVVYNNNGTMLSHKDGKETYETTTDLKGYMFLFKLCGTSIWRDAT